MSQPRLMPQTIGTVKYIGTVTRHHRDLTHMDNVDLSQNKTLGDLSREALWFSVHTLAALTVLVLVVGGIALAHPDADSLNPKLIGTLLAFLVPMAVGFLVARKQQNDIAGYVWISGLLVFSVVCVYVLDLPTGNGLCERCGAVDKLWRTFFDISHGSGLMSGDGFLIGTWIPLSMIGYAFGARNAID